MSMCHSNIVKLAILQLLLNKPFYNPTPGVANVSVAVIKC